MAQASLSLNVNIRCSTYFVMNMIVFRDFKVVDWNPIKFLNLYLPYHFWRLLGPFTQLLFATLVVNKTTSHYISLILKRKIFCIYNKYILPDYTQEVSSDSQVSFEPLSNRPLITQLLLVLPQCQPKLNLHTCCNWMRHKL